MHAIKIKFFHALCQSYSCSMKCLRGYIWRNKIQHRMSVICSSFSLNVIIEAEVICFNMKEAITLTWFL